MACWGTGWLPYGAILCKAPPAGHLEAVPPMAPWGRCVGREGRNRRSLALAAFTCYSRHSLHSLAGSVCPCKARVPPGAAQLSPAVPAAPPALPPPVTWASPQSRRPAAGAGGLCSSLSSWLLPEVRLTESGHWGRARGEIRGWGEWVAGHMHGVPWERPSACWIPSLPFPPGRKATGTAW